VTGPDLSISEAHPDFDQLASKEAKAAAERAKASANKPIDKKMLKALSANDLPAKFKIELNFGANRTVKGPNTFTLQVWESGKRIHGGGDDLMFFCLNVNNPKEGCQNFISSDYLKGGIAYCPNCKMIVNAELLARRFVEKWDTKQIAEMCADIFRKLNSDADIYVKYHKMDPRYLAMERAKGPDVARRLKGMHIYLRRNIVNDTSVGADLGKKIFGFLTS
jgi:hypothetical protein